MKRKEGIIVLGLGKVEGMRGGGESGFGMVVAEGRSQS